jgi:Carboxypeptidase regulatory-like domain/TonB dependent receptor-like, beta-barrel
MRLLKINGLFLAVLFCVQLPLWGQETRGTLLGRVTDQTGGVIVGARVEAANTDTGVRSAVTANESGDFLLPYLIPGPYSLTVEAPGFKKSVRPGISVRVNERITIDVMLEVGQAAETLQVTAETPLLDTSTTSIGQVIDSRTILELPLKDGMVLIMATLSPGVLFLPQSPGYVRPFDTSSPSQLSIDGTRAGSSEYMLDGAPNMQRAEVAYSPPPGVVDEFKIQSATFDAAYGYMAGGALNMSLKSGTNDLHGQLYYFHQNPAFNANRFFLNRIGAEKLRFRLHRWGTSFGGPVYLPKMYDGRGKTFWMYGYEGIWSFDPTPFVTEAVPTAAQRNGDFSALLALGPQYQIYDPFSTTAEAGGLFRRQPLPNNIIPPSRINPVARKIADLWDQPNQAGTIDGVNNYTKGKNAQDTYWNHIVRVDHNLSQKQRFYVRANFTLMDRPENERHNRAFGDVFVRQNRGGAFDHVYTISPRFFVNTRYSYTRFINAFTPMQLGWDLAGLGFASSYIQQIEQVDSRALRLPRIDVSGPTGVVGNSLLSSETLNKRHSDTHDFALNATSVVNTHTLRYGTGYRVYRENTFNLSNSSGSLEFATNWTRGPLSTSPSAPIGQGLASFLYGLPTGGNFPITDSYAEQIKIWAFYLQDDWKISRKLTLSLGLRYEVPSPLTERFNRSVRGFDFAAASPIEEQARANYANNPIPEVPVSQFQARGGLTFADVNGEPRTLWNTNRKNFMPRIGLAYSVTPNTVVRVGYGIYFEPIGVINQNVTQTGFSRSTELVTSVDNGQSYVANLTNPFPNGFLSPMGAAGGLSTNLGQGVSFFNEDIHNPYMQRWQLAVQQGLPGRSVLEFSYVGNRGVGQRIIRDLNALPNQYLSTSPVRDQNTINYLSAQVSNPFYPMLPGTNLAGTTVPRNQLLRPYPQFTNVNVADTNQGYSWYHSMQTRFEKRFSTGLASTLSWTWSKLMEARGFLNGGDPMPEEVISDQDRTHRIAITSLYELPFGRGKRWGGATNGAMSKIISGWQVQGIYTGQSGAPLGFGNAIFFGNLKDIVLPEGERTVERWFNVDAGFERNSQRQLGSNLRTFPSRFSGVRGDGGNNWDLSVIKNTEITEGVRLQFRAEAINALNHPQFLAPNTTPTSTAFGQVTDEWTWPRVIQFGLKILF